MYIYMYICIYIYVYIYIYVCTVYTYVYIYTTYIYTKPVYIYTHTCIIFVYIIYIYKPSPSRGEGGPRDVGPYVYIFLFIYLFSFYVYTYIYMYIYMNIWDIFGDIPLVLDPLKAPGSSRPCEIRVMSLGSISDSHRDGMVKSPVSTGHRISPPRILSCMVSTTRKEVQPSWAISKSTMLLPGADDSTQGLWKIATLTSARCFWQKKSSDYYSNSK